MLLVDIGNTRIKCARLTDKGLSAWPPLDTQSNNPFSQLQSNLLSESAPQRVVVANVAGAAPADKLIAFTQQTWQLQPDFIRTQRTCAGMTTLYQQPERLGVDRWLAALAGWHEYGAVCVVDAGTALTVDVVTTTGKHLGGLIAPGMDLMRAALQKNTAQLNSKSIQSVADFADNTEDAISLGCSSAVKGLLNETRVRVNKNDELADATWLLTGGGADALEALIDWPHKLDPYLVQRGLMLAAEANS